MAENRNNENEPAVNEYGEKIAPKTDKKEGSAPVENRRYNNYSNGKRPYNQRRPMLPPRGVSPESFDRQQISGAPRNAAQDVSQGENRPYEQRRPYKNYSSKPYYNNNRSYNNRSYDNR
ncbi:MAG: hypothetical protein ACI4RG_11340, partial [Huintestinicola sp.]